MAYERNELNELRGCSMSFANKARKIIAEMKKDDGYELNELNEKSPSPLPFFEADGSLVLPFNSDPRFHYWNGGQGIAETEREVKAWVH